jgi:hypothetical protein
MSDQLTLFPRVCRGEFMDFHFANPHVYDALVSMARRWKEAGNTTCSIKMLYEVLRWQVGITTSGLDFTLNNSYTSRYARLIAANEPDLADLFQMRQLHGGSW